MSAKRIAKGKTNREMRMTGSRERVQLASVIARNNVPQILITKGARPEIPPLPPGEVVAPARDG